MFFILLFPIFFLKIEKKEEKEEIRIKREKHKRKKKERKIFLSDPFLQQSKIE